MVGTGESRNHAPVEVQVVDVEPAQFGDPQAAPVEELEDGVVPQIAWHRPGGTTAVGSGPEQQVQLGVAEDAL